MNRYIFFLILMIPLCLLYVLYVGCANQKKNPKEFLSPSIKEEDMIVEIKEDIFIKNNIEIWRVFNNEYYFIFQAEEHEGITDPILSPNGKWVILIVTYPFDEVRDRVHQFYIVVNLDNGKRINEWEFGEGVISLNWVKTKAQTLLVTYANFEKEIDLESHLIKR